MSDLLDVVRVLGVKQFDLLAEVLFDVLADAHRLFRVDEVDGDSVLAEPSGAANAMQVSLAVSLARLIDGQIEIYNNLKLKSSQNSLL